MPMFIKDTAAYWSRQLRYAYLEVRTIYRAQILRKRCDGTTDRFIHRTYLRQIVDAGPGDDVALFFGPNSFQVTDFPYTFLYIDGDPIISLGGDGDEITIDYLLLNDKNGDNIVNINKDIFWIKPDIERLMIPDRSKLAIADHSGHTALVLWFMNRTHLFIAGHFSYHGFTIDIHEKVDITLPNGQHLRKFSDNCFYNHQLFLTTAGLDAVSPTKGTTELKLTP